MRLLSHAITLLIVTLLYLQTPLFAQINTPSGATIPFGTNTSYPGTNIMPTNLPTSGTYGASQDAANAYNQWKADYVTSCGGSNPEVFRVKFDSPTETVSEGIAYGMLLAVYAADKPLFDGLWQYYKNNMNGNGVMNWKVSGCNSVIGFGGATDAELDAALALIVANTQWPNSTSPHNYQVDATALITAIKDHEIQPTNANGPYQTNNGDAWGFGNNCRNPSYQSPAYYKVYAEFVPSQASFWNNVITASYDLINANVHPTTGLVSNWSDHTGTPNSCNGPDEHGWDACRNPWRMGTDVSWFGDADAKAICNNLASFVQGTGAPNLQGPIQQDGSAGQYHSPTFISTWAVGVMGSNSSYQSTLNSVYTETVAVTDPLPYYFGNTLRAICLFNLTGNFWLPTSSTPPSNFPVVQINSPTNGGVYPPGSPINITADITDADGTISSVTLEIDGVPISISNTGGDTWSTNWTPTVQAVYTVSITATDNDGQSSTSTVTITVNDGTVPPVASFTATPQSGASPLPVSFDASASTDPDGGSLSYSWNFGDGSTGTGVTTSHTYATDGNYIVTLTVTDDEGDTDSYSLTIIVNSSPCGLVAHYRTNDVDVATMNDNSVRPEFFIENTGSSAINLADVTFRYWFLREGTQGEQAWIDYSDMDDANITMSFFDVPSPTPDADRYIEYGFTSGAGTLAPGATTGVIVTRFNKLDWSIYDESNDYSFNANYSTYAPWQNITVYCNGLLAYGIEPTNCQPNLSINDAPIADGIYQAGQQVYSTGIVPQNGTVVFKAGNVVILDKNFKVNPGGKLDAEIEGCN